MKIKKIYYKIIWKLFVKLLKPRFYFERHKDFQQVAFFHNGSYWSANKKTYYEIPINDGYTSEFIYLK